jgi:hypothetical protein
VNEHVHSIEMIKDVRTCMPTFLPLLLSLMSLSREDEVFFQASSASSRSSVIPYRKEGYQTTDGDSGIQRLFLLLRGIHELWRCKPIPLPNESWKTLKVIVDHV